MPCALVYAVVLVPEASTHSSRGQEATMPAPAVIRQSVHASRVAAQALPWHASDARTQGSSLSSRLALKSSAVAGKPGVVNTTEPGPYV